MNASFWTEPRGWRSWAGTSDHKRIGVMFFVATSIALALGGTFALILRVELLTPDRTIVGPRTYDQLFTMHGIVMVWMFMIPSIPTAFGNFLVPLMIGARDVAFPRLNLASVYVYGAGATLTLVALVAGGVDTGWTFYAPYSTTTPGAVAKKNSTPMRLWSRVKTHERQPRWARQKVSACPTLMATSAGTGCTRRSRGPRGRSAGRGTTASPARSRRGPSPPDPSSTR